MTARDESPRRYICDICHYPIRVEAHGGLHPSPGDHDPAYHVAKAYKTGWTA